jgi:hypothetical protein
VADWHWEPVTDDLLDGLPPAALAAVRQAAEELTVRESMIFLDGREFTGEPPGPAVHPREWRGGHGADGFQRVAPSRGLCR